LSGKCPDGHHPEWPVTLVHDGKQGQRVAEEEATKFVNPAMRLDHRSARAAGNPCLHQSVL
jgi:hypothetical protein